MSRPNLPKLYITFGKYKLGLHHFDEPITFGAVYEVDLKIMRCGHSIKPYTNVCVVYIPECTRIIKDAKSDKHGLTMRTTTVVVVKGILWCNLKKLLVHSILQQHAAEWINIDQSDQSNESDWVEIRQDNSRTGSRNGSRHEIVLHQRNILCSSREEGFGDLM